MSYIDRHLESEENVVHRSRLHRAVFAWPVLFLLGAVVAWTNQAPPLGALLFIAAALTTIYYAIVYASTEVALTDRRLLMRVGVLRRRFIETPLDAVDEVQVSRSVVGRLLGYGTVRVNPGDDEHPPLPLVADPDRLAERIRERIRREPAESAEPAEPVAG